MNVRCKMRVVAKKDMVTSRWDGQKSTPAVMTQVSLNPVMDEANKSWASATPGGIIGSVSV